MTTHVIRTAIVNAMIVTADPLVPVIAGGTVVIEGERIAGVYSANDPLSVENADETIDAEGGILHPALINAHSHLAMTVFRGAADDRNLQGFLERILPLEAEDLDEVAVRAGIRVAIAESFLAGSTTALDMYFWPEVAAATAREAGFRLLCAPTVVGFPVPDCGSFAERIEQISEHPAEWVMAHGTYTMTTDELHAVSAIRSEQSARFTIHAAENQAEVDDVRSRTGYSPIGLLREAGLLGPTSVLAHAVVLDDDEVDLLGTTKTAIAHCPISNLKLASGICRVHDLLRAGATVALGTDGPSSSNDLDLYEVMRFTALLAKQGSGDASELPAADVFAMATVQGARALGLEGRTGVIAPGFDADLVLLDPDSPGLTPMVDPVASLVYAAGRHDVTDVWSRGRRVVAGRTLTTINLHQALLDLRAVAAKWIDKEVGK